MARSSDLKDVDCRELVEEMISRMGIDPNSEEAEQYRHACLTRAGYKTSVKYIPGDGDKGKDKANNDPDWF